MGKFAAGNPGKPKGAANKVTADLKAMILGALHSHPDGGGQGYLEEQMKANPTAFMTLLGKVLPTTLSNDPDHPFGLIAVPPKDE